MCHGQGLDLIILIINLNFHAPPPLSPSSPNRSLSQYASQLVHERKDQLKCLIADHVRYIKLE